MKRTVWVFLLLFALLLAACGGTAIQPSTAPTTTGGEIFQIALPRLVVSIDSQGNPSILGISPMILSSLGVDTSGFQVPPQTVAALTKAGIQHIEVASVGDRLVFFANGKPVPYLGWSQDSLNRALDLAAKLEIQNAALFSKLLPMFTRLGLDVVLQFPLQPGTTAIPMTEIGVAKSLRLAPSAAPTSLVLKFEVKFDDAGRPAILGLSAQDLQALGLAGIPQLTPDLIQKLKKANLQNAELRTQPDGLRLYVNNEPLPTLGWDSTLLTNLVEVYAKMSPGDPTLPLVQNIVPFMDRADIGILLHFPVAAGMAPIPAKMH